MAWKSGKTPQDRTEAIIIPIHKKDCRAECGNDRGISLLNVVRKVYARIVSDGVKILMDELVMDEQGGFRAGRGCIDQVFAMRQVIEKVIEKDNGICSICSFRESL